MTSRRTSSGSLSAHLPNQYHQHDANDRLTHHGCDANGNTVTSPTSDLGSPTSASDVYSFDNRLIRRERGDGLSIDLLYNPDGDRVAKWVQQNGLNESIHRYLVDRVNPTGYAQVVEEKDGSGTPVAGHLYSHDLIASDKWGPGGSPGVSTRRWYHYDGLGSVRGLSDDDGGFVEDYTYDAYGTLIAFRQLDPATGQLALQPLANLATLTENRYLFTGEQWDADLGMHFLRARYLNPDTWRFHTQDTYEGRNKDPLSLHKYLYAHADPANNTDPSGNFTLTGAMVKGVLLSVALPTMSVSSLAIRFLISQIQIAIGLKYIRSYYPSMIEEAKRQASKVRPPKTQMEFIMASEAIKFQMIDVTKKVLLGTITVHLGAIYNLGHLALTVKKLNDDLVTAIERVSNISGGRIEGHPDRLGAAFSFLTFSASPWIAIDALGNIIAARESQNYHSDGRLRTVIAINSFMISLELSKYGDIVFHIK